MRGSWKRMFCVWVPLILLGTGCDFDEFVDESYQIIQQRNPLVHALYDVDARPPESLDTVSDDYLARTYALEAAVLKKLEEFDYESLTPEQRVTYDVYRDYLTQDLEGKAYRFYNLWYGDELRLAGFPAVYYWFKPVESYDDALEFAQKLVELKNVAQQTLDNYNTAAKKEIIPSRMIIESRIGDWLLNCGLDQPGGEYVGYAEMLGYKIEMAGLELSEAQWTELESVLDASIEQYSPICDQLLGTLLGLAEQSPADAAGAWTLPDGQEYYSYRLQFHNDTELTAEEVHQLGHDELAKIHQQLYDAFETLGYPPNLTIPQLTSLLNEECPRVTREALGPTLEAILADAESRLHEIIDIVPATELILVYTEGVAGAYAPAPLDGSGPGIFQYSVPYGADDVSSIMLRSLAYHEGFPGHHVQISIAQEMDVPRLQKIHFSNAYTEGWALYSERLSRELDWYGDDVCGEMGQLLSEAFRAVRLIVDTGLHSFEWSPDQAIEFMYTNLGEHTSIAPIPQEVFRYIGMPGQATGYYIGLQKVLALREKAQEALGDDFDLVEFNHAVLGSGNVDLPTLERLIDEYLAEKL